MGIESEYSVLMEGISCASLTERRTIGPTFSGSPWTVKVPSTRVMRSASVPRSLIQLDQSSSSPLHTRVRLPLMGTASPVHTSCGENT